MGNYYETCCKCGKTKTIIPDTTSDEYTQKEKETMKE
jgi:hypothetical protein